MALQIRSLLNETPARNGSMTAAPPRYQQQQSPSTFPSANTLRDLHVRSFDAGAVAGGGFASPPPLQERRRPVDSEEPRAMPILPTHKGSVCKTCGEGFQCDSLRRKHEARHTKPYKCHIKNCARHTVGFTSKNDLSRHLNSVHKGTVGAAVGYNCKYGNCRDKKKIYYRLDNFRNHLKKLHSPRTRGETAADFIKRAELECRTEDASAMDLSEATASDSASLPAGMMGTNMMSDTESVSTMARSVMSPDRNLLSPRRTREYPPTYPYWKPQPQSGPHEDAMDIDVEHTSSPSGGTVRANGTHPVHRSREWRQSRIEELHRQMRILQTELQALEEQDREEMESQQKQNQQTADQVSRAHGSAFFARLAQENGLPERRPSLSEQALAGYPSGTSEPLSRFIAQDPKEDPVRYSIPASRNPELTESAAHREKAKNSGAPTRPDRNSDMSSTNMPSPPETVDSPPDGQRTRAGSRHVEDAPRTPGPLPPTPGPVPIKARPNAPSNRGGGRSHHRIGSTPINRELLFKKSETMIRAFQCPHAGCTSRFHRECELRKHKRRHTKPYECTFGNCHSVFGSKNDWKRHENSQHHRLEMWKCEIPVGEDGDVTDICGKVQYRKENYVNHLKSASHGIKDKAEQDKWVKQCYQPATCDESFWCGFCTDQMGNRGMKVKLKNQGPNGPQKGLAGWDERFDHLAAHFEAGLMMKSYVHPNNDVYTDESSFTDDEDPTPGSELVSGLDQLADAAEQIQSVAPRGVLGPDELDAISHPVPIPSPDLRKKKTDVWYCCDPGGQHNGFPHLNLVALSASCLDCQHAMCDNCTITKAPRVKD